MPRKPDPLLQAVSAMGNATRRNDHAAVAAARQRVAYIRIERAIRKELGLLSDEQRAELAAVLVGS